MPGQLPHRAVTPDVLVGERGDQRGPEPEPGAGRRHIGLGPADLHVERAGLLEAKGRRRGQAQHDLAQTDQIVQDHARFTRRR